jgi:hypothetical protein
MRSAMVSTSDWSRVNGCSLMRLPRARKMHQAQTDFRWEMPLPAAKRIYISSRVRETKHPKQLPVHWGERFKPPPAGTVPSHLETPLIQRFAFARQFTPIQVIRDCLGGANLRSCKVTQIKVERHFSGAGYGLDIILCHEHATKTCRTSG